MHGAAFVWCELENVGAMTRLLQSYREKPALGVQHGVCGGPRGGVRALDPPGIPTGGPCNRGMRGRWAAPMRRGGVQRRLRGHGVRGERRGGVRTSGSRTDREFPNIQDYFLGLT